MNMSISLRMLHSGCTCVYSVLTFIHFLDMYKINTLKSCFSLGLSMSSRCNYFAGKITSAVKFTVTGL